MTIRQITWLFAATLFISGCEFKCSVGNTDPKPAVESKGSNDSPVKGAVIKNDVELEATGVKLSEAYLMDKDRNLLTENEIPLNEYIYLVLKTDTGWVKENGMSFLGAAERISDANGTVVADEPDIFKQYDSSGFSAEDAKLMRLSAIIRKALPDDDQFTVQFRVWDKRGEGEIKGKYKFRIKK
jgi:hypothetical protein